jgi:predicted TIM-barrel fold metal-dependent hydrolase
VSAASLSGANVSAIDFHAYYQPPRFLAHLRRREQYPRIERTDAGEAVFTAPGAGRLLRPEQLDLDKRIELMDKAGVKAQILRLQNVGGIDAFGPDEATDMARMINEELSEIARRYPGRFLPFAAVPLQAPDKAYDELTYAVTRLGHRGVGASCQVGGIGLDDPKYRPLLRTVEALRVPVLVLPNHPSLLDASLRPYHWLSGAFGFQVDLTWAALRLLASGALEQMPGLIVIVANLGGVLASITERLDEYWNRVHAGTITMKQRPSVELRRMYYETASADPRAIALAASILGSDRLLFGSDYPSFALERGMRNVLETGLPAADIQAILSGNAARLFSGTTGTEAAA